MIKIGILLITTAIIIIFYIIRDLIKKSYPDDQKVRVIDGILGVAFILLCTGIALIMQVVLGPGWISAFIK